MSQFYCREDELRKLNKRYAGDSLSALSSTADGVLVKRH